MTQAAGRGLEFSGRVAATFPVRPSWKNCDAFKVDTLLPCDPRGDAHQAQALALMQKASEAGDADPADMALLTDRVLLAQGKPQRYGTQFADAGHGVMELRPAEDLTTLDARRRAVGLQPLDAYKAMLSEMYGKQVR